MTYLANSVLIKIFLQYIQIMHIYIVKCGRQIRQVDVRATLVHNDHMLLQRRPNVKCPSR